MRYPPKTALTIQQNSNILNNKKLAVIIRYSICFFSKRIMRLPLFLRILLYPFIFLGGLGLMVAAIAVLVVAITYPKLPSLETITDYHPKIPLRVYSADGFLIGEFGEERRNFVRIEDVPQQMKNAILAAEDDRFYEHSGIDFTGIARALISNMMSGGKRQGASTITQQVARNFFLSSEKTYTRKFYEALLSFKIEHSLTKDQILELYVNQIFLGQRAYGFAAASRVYFGKHLAQLSTAEMAMLAGLPKAPSLYNPVSNPSRAKVRQRYVLRRLLDLGYISHEEYAAAEEEPLLIKRELATYSVHADFVAEMARQAAEEAFPEDVYTSGYKVYTTILKPEQEAAYSAIRQGLLNYDNRHGYQGEERFIDLKALQAKSPNTPLAQVLDNALQYIPNSEDLIPAVVLSAEKNEIRAYHKLGEAVILKGDAIKRAQNFLGSSAAKKKRRLKAGSVIRLVRNAKGQWVISQLPDAEAALVSIDPQSGAVRALIGGFDFARNKYNHATQAWRQPGSAFKPFIFSAALEKGYTPATIVYDEPLTISAADTGSKEWTPNNYDKKFEGPITLRRALNRSKNVPAVRLMRAISADYAQGFLKNFGFDEEKHPPYLTTALGAGSVTVWQMTNAYSIFANGGFQIAPYVLAEILNANDEVVWSAKPQEAGDEANRVLDARNAFVMHSYLNSVAIYGTAARSSSSLKRQDLGAKTGTSNDYRDAWFCGYQKARAACVWMGYDQPKKLGNRETGGVAAQPIWIDYMKTALSNAPLDKRSPPPYLLNITNDKGEQDWIYAENKDFPPQGEPQWLTDGAIPMDESMAEEVPSNQVQVIPLFDPVRDFPPLNAAPEVPTAPNQPATKKPAAPPKKKSNSMWLPMG